jgi:glycosyltransferase involved in cell wall biosynthesis
VFAYQGVPEIHHHPRIEQHLVGGFDADKRSYYSWPNKLRADARLIAALRRQRDHIDLVHCHTIEGLGIALGFKWSTGSHAPICIDVHGPIVPELVHYRMIPDWRWVVAGVAGLERFMLGRTQHAFVSNEGLKSLLAERVSPERVSVVFDYVDLDVFRPERIDPSRVAELRRRFKPNGERLITFLGMFKDYQGVDYLLHAFAALSRDHADVRLLLVGDGPCKAQYEQIIRSAGLEQRIIMPGLVPHHDVVNWLEVSDFVVSPRVDNQITRAGFVSQLPEYMAMGKLVVATAVSGCSYLLRDSAGILVVPNDIEALRQALERALALGPAEAARLIAKAHENVSQFTWQQGIGEVHRVYRRLVANRSETGLAANSHDPRNPA